jgi:NADH:quinone reductase (non-electrogenic)
MTQRPHVVVIGGGFGGLHAVRGLRDADVDVTLVDKANHHLFQPLLYQAATSLLPPADIAVPFRQVFEDQPNVTVVMGTATDVDVRGRSVTVSTLSDERRELSYDFLVAAVGAVPNYFGHEEWASVAPAMKSLEDAVDLRDRVLGALETAASTTEEEQRRQHLTFAVIGAGPTGVELAGQLAAMGRRMLTDQYRELPHDQFRIVLADAGEHVLAPFDPRLRDHAGRKLRDLGVELNLGRSAVAVDHESLTLGSGPGGDRETIAAGTVIWAAGVQPHHFTATLAAAAGADTDGKGRLKVGLDCSLAGHPEILAIGDMVDLNGLPGIAEPAIQEGRYVARVIRHRIGERPSPGDFRYLDLGIMATISPADAVAQRGRLRLRGAAAKLAWAAVHVGFLVGWGHKATVLTKWAWTVATGNRQQQVMLRTTRAPS